MIKRFHEIIEKKSILKAKTFLHGSSQLCLTQTTISEQETEIIEDDTDDDRFEKVSKSQVCFSCLSETSFRNSPTLFFSQCLLNIYNQGFMYRSWTLKISLLISMNCYAMKTIIKLLSTNLVTGLSKKVGYEIRAGTSSQHNRTPCEADSRQLRLRCSNSKIFPFSLTTPNIRGSHLW